MDADSERHHKVFSILGKISESMRPKPLPIVVSKRPWKSPDINQPSKLLTVDNPLPKAECENPFEHKP